MITSTDRVRRRKTEAAREAFEQGAHDLTPQMVDAFESIKADFFGGSDQASYYAASNNQQMPMPRGIAALGSGADYHYSTETEYFRIVERSRYYERDNMVVGQAIGRLVANIIQDGFTLDVRTPDEEANKDIAARFEEWGATPKECDLEGLKDFRDFENLTLRHTIVDGDLIQIPTRDGQIQFLENHRLRSPTGRQSSSLVHGVELNESRQRTGYLVSTKNVGPLEQIAAKDLARVPALDAGGFRNLWHIFNPRRMSQTRGVSCLAPAVVPINFHDDLQFAAMIKAKVASFYALFREFSDDAPDPPTGRTMGSRTTETNSDGTTTTFEEGRPGAVVRGERGEKLVGFSPNIPNPEFFPHTTMILTLIAVNLDLPVAVLMLDPSNTNFSGWRGAMDQARMKFRQIQSWQRRSFHSPCYLWKLRQFIAADRSLLRLANRYGSEFFRHRWNPPTWPYIEPLKDAAADDLRISRNLTSQRRRAAERGFDFNDLAAEIVSDRELIIATAIDRAKELSARSGVEIDWRELAYGPPTNGVSYQFVTDQGSSNADTN